MARGATGFPRPVKVIVDAGDKPSVSVAPFVSDLDELEREREQHETRRLLYVAITRARDRLYLSSVLKDGVLKPGPGSLAEVLPAGIKGLFASSASTTDGAISWIADSGRVFSWRVFRANGVPPAASSPAAETEVRPALVDTWLEGSFACYGTRRIAATEYVRDEGDTLNRTSGSSGDEALVGRLVHRLLQAATHSNSNLSARELVVSLLRAEEAAVSVDPERVLDSALSLWIRLQEREELRAVLDGTVLAEVPFSMRTGEGTILRGTIDVLGVAADGSITVVELKTGAPRAAHERQLQLYVSAAQKLFPDRIVRGLLIHA
jgi:ATP-dependent helicase/nuclease subunit A